MGICEERVRRYGKVIGNQFIYTPYGYTLTGSQAISCSEYKYNGKELDEKTGLYYYGARYYHSTIGRWVSADPLYLVDPSRQLSNPQALNLYSYVENNPIIYMDPLGHQILLGRDRRKAYEVINDLKKALPRNEYKAISLHVFDWFFDWLFKTI